MKTLALALSLASAFFGVVSNSGARIVTLTTSLANTNASLTIVTNESITLLYGKMGGNNTVVRIERDGLQQEYLLSVFDSASSSTTPRVVIAGPAKVSLVNFNGGPGGFSFLSVDIQADSFPPDKSVIVPEGSGANIVLESSTNLIDWTVAAPGLYTNRTGNLFLRIRADRTP